MNLWVLFSRQRLDLLCRPGIALRKTVVDDRRQFPDGLRNLLPRFPTCPPYFLRHVLRRQKSRIVDVDTRCNRLLCGARTDLSKPKFRRTLLSDRLDHPESHDIFQIAEPAVVTALVCHVVRSRRTAAIRRHPFGSHERPCAGADIERLFLLRWHRRHRRGGIVCGRQDHLAGKSHFFLDLPPQAPQFIPRHPDLLKQPSRIAQLPDQLLIPVLCHRTNQLGRRRIGVLLHLFPGQKKMKIIRHHQQTVRLLQPFWMLLPYRSQLIDRVKDLFLDSCSVVEFFLRDMSIHFFIHALCPAVAVGCRISDTSSLPIQKDIVHRPGINPHAVRDFPQSGALLHAV